MIDIIYSKYLLATPEALRSLDGADGFPAGVPKLMPFMSLNQCFLSVLPSDGAAAAAGCLGVSVTSHQGHATSLAQ